MMSSKSHTGELIVKEKYGSSSSERLFVKPQEQSKLVVLDQNKMSDIAGWFTRVFMPQGYPESVSKDYLDYQIWDTAQAFCSTITGTLATQEVLRGVGVGDTAATPLSATFTWVLKEGCGHLGRILFAFSHGTSLDAYSKKWRLCADTLNDAAMLIEIALPLFRNYITFALCVSTTMKAIVGVAGGATRAAMTQHHAIRGNMADVSAKDSAQETAVNLVASIVALLLISFVGSSHFIFATVMVLHICFNYLAVRAVCLKTLNEPRFLQVINYYLRHEEIRSPCLVNKSEPIIFYQLGSYLLDLKYCGFHIVSGRSLKEIVSLKDTDAAYLNAVMQVYAQREYILYPSTSHRMMHILIKSSAGVDDILCAYFHAVVFSTMICAINNEPLRVFDKNETSRPFAEICSLLAKEEWTRQQLEYDIGYSGLAYTPSFELMHYVNRIVHAEWPRIRMGLQYTGYDLSKHLILCDEWRISHHAMDVNAIKPCDETQDTEKATSTDQALPFECALHEIKEHKVHIGTTGRISVTQAMPRSQSKTRYRKNLSDKDLHKQSSKNDISTSPPKNHSEKDLHKQNTKIGLGTKISSIVNKSLSKSHSQKDLHKQTNKNDIITSPDDEEVVYEQNSKNDSTSPSKLHKEKSESLVGDTLQDGLSKTDSTKHIKKNI